MQARTLALALVLLSASASGFAAPDATTPADDAAKLADSTAVDTASAPRITDTPVPSSGVAGATIASAPDHARRDTDIPNPAIDMFAYLRVSEEAAAYRQSHRVSEEDFLRMSGEANTIVLDARSAEKFRLLHVKGAINLSFPDITVDSLKQTIPDKSTRILIYCNNNFTGAPKPFPSKLPSASLNLSTYIALYNYGYRNVYELGPLIDLKSSKLAFDGAPDDASDSTRNATSRSAPH
jgi:hypothetical protein